MGGVIFPPSPNWYGAHLCDFEAPAYAFCAQNAIVVLDSRRMAVTSILRGHGNRTTALTFVKSDSQPLWIVSAASDNTLRFWVCVDDTRLVFACRRALSKRPSEIKAIVNVCRTDGIALFGDQAGNLFRCTVGVGAKLQKLEGCRRSSPVICLAAVSLVTASGQDCHAAAVGCENGEISLIDWKLSCVLSTLHTHTNEIHCLRWMSGLLLSSSMDTSLRIHKVEVTDCGSAGECQEEGQSVTWDEIAHVKLPKPPENATSSQKSRLWFASEWFGWHLEMMTGQDRLPPALWVLGSSYGGAILAWKVPLSQSTERLADSEVQPPIKLPATHGRTIFSIRCQIDTSLSGQPGVQILTISMDRYVYSLWAPLSLVNALYSSGRVAATECPGGLPELQEETARTCKDTWSKIGPSAKRIPGLGGFAHDISLQCHTGECTEKMDLGLKMAIGCGDECIRIADVSFEIYEFSEGWSPRFERKDDSLLWQGIPSGVTCLAWHPSMKNVLVFGCKDGSVGLAMCTSSGPVVLGAPRHKAPLTRVAWASKHMFETAEGTDQSSDADNHGNDTIDYKLLTLSADGICLEWPVLENIESAFPLTGSRFKTHHQQDAQHRQPHPAGDMLGNPRKVMDGSQLIAIVTTVGKKHLAAIAFIDGRIAIAFRDEAHRMIWRYDVDSQHQGVDVSTGCLLACDVDGSVVAAVHQNKNLLTLYWRPCDNKSANIKPAAQLHLPALDVATSLAVTTSFDDGMVLVAIGFRDGMIQTFLWRWTDDTSIVAGKSRSIHGGTVLTMAWGRQTEKGGKGEAWFLVSGSEDQSVQIHWDIVQIGSGEQLSVVYEEKEAEPELNEAHDVRSTKEAKLPKPQGESKKGLKLTLGSKALLPPLPARNTSQGQDILQNSISDMIVRFKNSHVLDKDVALNVFLNLGYLDTVDPVASLSGAATTLKPLEQDTGSAAQVSQTSRPKHSSIDVRKLQAQRAAALELWSGDVGSAIATLLEYDALTADFVSMSASAGRQAWEAVVRVYAAQLESKGEIHMSVLQLLSVGDVEAACDVYIRLGMVREAATLASARLPPDHPKTVAARSSYISLLESRREWECVAAHYTGMGHVDRAMRVLSESGTLPSLRRNKEEDAMESGCRTQELEEKLSMSSRRQYSREFLLSMRDVARNANVRLGCIPSGLQR